MNEVSKTYRQKQSMAPIHWIAIVCLVGIAVAEKMDGQAAPDTLEHFNREALTVVRLSDASFDFPILGVRVTPPDEWVYLSTTNPTLADRPTFYNASDQSIVRLMHPALWQPKSDQPEFADDRAAKDKSESPVGTSTEKSESDKPPAVQWYHGSDIEHHLNLTIDGFPVEVSWPTWTPYRIGRFRSGNIDLVVQWLATFDDAHHIKGRSPVNQVLAEFCQHLEALPQ